MTCRALPGVLAVLVCPLLAPAAAPGDPDTPEFKKAAALIDQLGSARFAVRETAAKQLVEMGRAAKPALLAARDHSDPEVADRCRRLLPQALSADFQARVDAFVADKELKQPHDLTGWDRYQKLAGKDGPARELFIEMLKTNAALFTALELDPKSFPERYAGRCQELTAHLYGPNPQSRAQPKAADLATVFLFGADPETARATRSDRMFVNILHQPAFRNALTGDKGAPFRKLFLTWMENRTDPLSVNQCLAIVQQQNLKEGVGYALRVLGDKDRPAYLRAQSATIVGNMGGKEHLPALEKVLDDDTFVGNAGPQMGTIQVRDVALAMVIHLSGQKPQEFGFESLARQPNQVFQYYYLGFANDEKRAAARKKWDEFAARERAKK